MTFGVVVLSRLIRSLLVLGATLVFVSSAKGQQTGWGAEYATPNTRLSVIEKGRQQTAAGIVAVYVLRAEGFSGRQPYGIWIWAMSSGGASKPMRSAQVTIDAGGKLYTPDGTELVLMFPIETVLKGDSFDIGVVSADGSERNFVLITPLPIENKNGRCKLSAGVAGPLGTAYVLRGEGFRPDEELQLSSTSEGEAQQTTFRVDATGKWRFLLLPVVKGKRKGKVQFEIAGANCTVKGSGNWRSPDN